jgi:hypothetical protein
VRAVQAAAACLVLAAVASARPAFCIGPKLTWRGDAGGTMWYNDQNFAFVEQSYGEEFGAVGVEATYGPIWGISGRVDVAQVGFLESGQSFRLFPALGIDLMAEPPVTWRARPYLWAGASVGSYRGVTGGASFLLLDGDETHLRAGLGAKYRLSRRVELFAEGRFFALDSRWNGWFNNGFGVVRLVDEKPPAFRLAGVDLGARFALGR